MFDGGVLNIVALWFGCDYWAFCWCADRGEYHPEVSVTRFQNYNFRIKGPVYNLKFELVYKLTLVIFNIFTSKHFYLSLFLLKIFFSINSEYLRNLRFANFLSVKCLIISMTTLPDLLLFVFDLIRTLVISHRLWFFSSFVFHHKSNQSYYKPLPTYRTSKGFLLL